jgi:hypothetical protein
MVGAENGSRWRMAVFGLQYCERLRVSGILKERVTCCAKASPGHLRNPCLDEALPYSERDPRTGPPEVGPQTGPLFETWALFATSCRGDMEGPQFGSTAARADG